MFTHECLKCKIRYQDSDPDPYYCESCITAKQKIAKEIDKKFSTVGKEPPMTPLKEYDAAPKVHGFMRVK